MLDALCYRGLSDGGRRRQRLRSAGRPVRLSELLPVRIQRDKPGVCRLPASVQPVWEVGPGSSDVCQRWEQGQLHVGSNYAGNWWESFSLWTTLDTTSLQNVLADMCFKKNYTTLNVRFSTDCDYTNSRPHNNITVNDIRKCDITNSVVTTNMLRFLFSGICPLGVVEGNDRQFMLGNETMDCAPGTMFNFTVCTCVRYEPCKLAATMSSSADHILL